MKAPHGDHRSVKLFQSEVLGRCMARGCLVLRMNGSRFQVKGLDNGWLEDLREDRNAGVPIHTHAEAMLKAFPQWLAVL